MCYFVKFDNFIYIQIVYFIEKRLVIIWHDRFLGINMRQSYFLKLG